MTQKYIIQHQESVEKIKLLLQPSDGLSLDAMD